MFKKNERAIEKFKFDRDGKIAIKDQVLRKTSGSCLVRYKFHNLRQLFLSNT